MIMLFASVGIAITIYGSSGHDEPILTYLLGIGTLVVGGFPTVAAYLLNGLVDECDEQLPKNQIPKKPLREKAYEVGRQFHTDYPASIYPFRGYMEAGYIEKIFF
jgi:hypothetical protein